MTTEAAAAAPVPGAIRARMLLYLAFLILMLGMGSPFLVMFDVPISFMLKNRLHLGAHDVATFRLISAVPLYLSFLFGFARDIWSPFGMKDRGFIVLFGAISAAIYAVFAFMPITYFTLLAAVLLLTISFQFVSAAQNGLAATIGQQHLMSGQVSAVWNIFISVPALGAFLVGGWLGDRLEGEHGVTAARMLFLTGAAIMTAVTLYGAWRPASIFDHIHPGRGRDARPWEDVKRLAKHWPIYPALLIWLLWNFAPGSATSLQFYLQDTLHAKDAAFGQWYAIFSASFIPTFMLFGVLCRKVSLGTLLLWGAVAAIPQMVPLLFVHSVTGALISAAPIGLMGGVATAAYMDLLIRSCPKGLEGTVLMMSGGLYYISSRFGDVLGAALYDRFGGFTVCVIATTVVYALILPVLLFVPGDLVGAADGEIAADAGT